ncbi:hypothetical protein Mal33_32270 [Rosistilla oblonga]|uniref:Uncharacterized protein n=1 Tax=Rosistilla oblonga TaxID=2527990 RepID=A0A518IVV9_9BACT|nr:hypothetical protein Mal33_32270 [Rosistilla oblonga]
MMFRALIILPLIILPLIILQLIILQLIILQLIILQLIILQLIILPTDAAKYSTNDSPRRDGIASGWRVLSDRSSQPAPGLRG